MAEHVVLGCEIPPLGHLWGSAYGSEFTQPRTHYFEPSLSTRFLNKPKGVRRFSSYVVRLYFSSSISQVHEIWVVPATSKIADLRSRFPPRSSGHRRRTVEELEDEEKEVEKMRARTRRAPARPARHAISLQRRPAPSFAVAEEE